MTPPPLSLYIHLPWCVSKCPYCDFNSHELKTGAPPDRYIDTLLADLEADLPLVWGRTVVSIFLGGGTPSLFSPDQVERLLTGVATRVTLRPDVEITMEANPGTLECGRLADYRAAGVNRVSLGVQSFDDDALKSLGRIHSGAAAADAVAEALDAGFNSVNLDLMYALPNQSMQAMEADLHRALALGVPHLSHYQLTLEPNTRFHHQPPAGIPDIDRSADMMDHAQRRLEDAGFEQYEVSAYAQPGHQCRHNLNYWRFGDYLGIGAGAHGKITDGASGRILRRLKQRHPRSYLDSADRVVEDRELTVSERPFEFLLNALRLKQGFTVQEFEQNTGVPFAQVEPDIRREADLELLDVDDQRIKASARGYLFLNEVLERFLPGDEGDVAA
ncbi:MAG: radical SAM family heme chaperone HemW [Pseudomonadota bacterium]